MDFSHCFYSLEVALGGQIMKVLLIGFVKGGKFVKYNPCHEYWFYLTKNGLKNQEGPPNDLSCNQTRKVAITTPINKSKLIT